jgi:polar amino acid transport system substrate-binding protein
MLCAVLAPAAPAVLAGDARERRAPETRADGTTASAAGSECRTGTADTLARIRKCGVMRVGVALAAPMVVRHGDGVAGFSIDVATELARDLGVRTEFVLTTWDEVVADLVEGDTDLVIAGLWPTVDRALLVNFTTPTAVEGVYLVASSKVPGRAKSDFDRPGIRIATFPDTVQARAARRHFPRATHVDVKPDEKELDFLLRGRADAAVVSTISPGGVLEAARGQVRLPLSDPLQTTPAAIAVRKGDPDFLNFLETWLSIHRGEGWLEERAAHWTEEMEWYASDLKSAAGDPEAARPAR